MLLKAVGPSALMPLLIVKFRSAPPVKVRLPVERTLTLPTVVVPAGRGGFAFAVVKQTLPPLVGGPTGVQFAPAAHAPAPSFHVNAPPGHVTWARLGALASSSPSEA